VDTRQVSSRPSSYVMHRSAWKGYSANFAFTTFSEVREGVHNYRLHHSTMPHPGSALLFLAEPCFSVAALLQGTGCQEGWATPNPSTILSTLLPSVSIL
jgi:hypothetical protein